MQAPQGSTASWTCLRRARCSRGAYGTVRAAHKANATVSHLIGIYGGFLPDPRTDLIDEVMANVASVYNEAGLDM